MEDINKKLCKLLDIDTSINLFNPDNFVKLIECQFEWDLDVSFSSIFCEILQNCDSYPDNRTDVLNILIFLLEHHYCDTEEYLIKAVKNIKFE